MDDDLRLEYDLEKLLEGGLQGKYAARFEAGTNLVRVDPDEQAVNEALRLVLQLPRIPVARNSR